MPPAKLRTVTWEGALPKPGEFVRLALGGVYWQIKECTPIGQNRITLRATPLHTDDPPEGAVLHPYARVQPIDPAGPPRVRQVAGSGSTAVMRGAWRDPTDIVPNAARRPREVRGWRVFCAVRGARLRGSDITEEHIVAADILRQRYDLARLGASGAMLAEPTAGMPGPRSGPSNGALRAARASHSVGHLFRALSDEHATLLTVVVLDNISVSRWCGMHDPKLDKRVVMRQLIEALDILVDYFQEEIRHIITTEAAVIAD